MEIKFSVIIPTFKRENEIKELLISLSNQTFTDFEVLISDGSPSDQLRSVVEEYEKNLNLHYLYFKGYSASESRNVGGEKAKGTYLVFFDSDCIIPTDYFTEVVAFLSHTPLDGYGGPDAAKHDFNSTMKAINYAMTSFFTTGGIRGGKQHVGKFLMRGFNMAIKKTVFDAVGGYSGMEVAEDIELSVRINKAGYKTRLIPNAFVYHKRRSTLLKFFKQLKMHGKGRIDLYLRHKDQLKLVHFIPSFFVVYLFFLLILSTFKKELMMLGVAPLLAFLSLLWIDSLIKYKNLYTSIKSVIASVIMLVAYGLGLLENIYLRLIRKKKSNTKKLEELKN